MGVSSKQSDERNGSSENEERAKWNERDRGKERCWLHRVETIEGKEERDEQDDDLKYEVGSDMEKRERVVVGIE